MLGILALVGVMAAIALLTKPKGRKASAPDRSSLGPRRGAANSPARRGGERLVPPPVPPRSEPARRTSGLQTAPGVTIRALTDTPRLNAVAKSAARARARWIAPGQPIQLLDLTISGGLFYLASCPIRGFAAPNWIIDPALPVAPARSAKTDPPSYYPSYSNITSAQRRGFLEWMAGGRSDPNENLSLVFLFVYGLEYRLLGEGVTVDAPQIIAEAERLLSVYGRHRSFAGYVGRFLSFARAYAGITGEPQVDGQDVWEEMALPARLYLGRRLIERTTLTATDAFIWATASPISWGRRRWPREQIDVFRELWIRRFNRKYPSGLPVAPPAKTITANYRAMSAQFETRLADGAVKLPDPALDLKTAEALATLVESCWKELGRYHSRLTRVPNSAEALETTILMPIDLWIYRFHKGIAKLVPYLGEARTKATQVGEVLSVAGVQADGAAGKSVGEAVSRIAKTLGWVGIGIEPDGPRDSGDLSHLALTAPARLFRLPAGDRGEPLSDKARLAVDVAILCAHQADSANEEARARAASAVAAAIGADDEAATRLTAYAAIVQPDAKRRTRLMKAGAALPEEFKHAAASAAVAALAAGTRASAASVKQLEWLYKALGLPADELYAALHRAPTGGETHSEAEIGASARAAVERELNGSPSVVIDATVLDRARKSTQAVADVLSEIFVEEAAPSSSPAAIAVASSDGPFEGLDAAHGKLLSAILDAGSLPHGEFDRLARSAKLFPGGAVDNINEWAFDRFEESVVDDADELSIAPHLVERLKEMRVESNE